MMSMAERLANWREVKVGDGIFNKVIEICTDFGEQEVVVNWFPEYSREKVLEFLAKAIARVQVIPKDEK